MDQQTSSTSDDPVLALRGTSRTLAVENGRILPCASDTITQSTTFPECECPERAGSLGTVSSSNGWIEAFYNTAYLPPGSQSCPSHQSNLCNAAVEAPHTDEDIDGDVLQLFCDALQGEPPVTDVEPIVKHHAAVPSATSTPSCSPWHSPAEVQAPPSALSSSGSCVATLPRVEFASRPSQLRAIPCAMAVPALVMPPPTMPFAIAMPVTPATLLKNPVTETYRPNLSASRLWTLPPTDSYSLAQDVGQFPGPQAAPWMGHHAAGCASECAAACADMAVAAAGCADGCASECVVGSADTAAAPAALLTRQSFCLHGRPPLAEMPSVAMQPTTTDLGSHRVSSPICNGHSCAPLAHPIGRPTVALAHSSIAACARAQAECAHTTSSLIAPITPPANVSIALGPRGAMSSEGGSTDLQRSSKSKIESTTTKPNKYKCKRCGAPKKGHVCMAPRCGRHGLGGLRKEWDRSEDELIVQLVANCGGRWRHIASKLPGRTDDAVRNRWNRLKEQLVRPNFAESKNMLSSGEMPTFFPPPLPTHMASLGADHLPPLASFVPILSGLNDIQVAHACPSMHACHATSCSNACSQPASRYAPPAMSSSVGENNEAQARYAVQSPPLPNSASANLPEPISPPPETTQTPSFCSSASYHVAAGTSACHADDRSRAECRSQWTRAEDSIIVAGVEEFGHKWNLIADRLKGRTDHAIRNRWSRLQMMQKWQTNNNLQQEPS